MNLTSSDNVVLLNCPLYVDQIEYISQDFRIERAFYISGNENAVTSWRESFCAQGGGDSNTRNKLFSEHIERLQPIVVHFSRLGKLEQFDVIDTPKPAMLQHMIGRA